MEFIHQSTEVRIAENAVIDSLLLTSTNSSGKVSLNLEWLSEFKVSAGNKGGSHNTDTYCRFKNELVMSLDQAQDLQKALTRALAGYRPSRGASVWVISGGNYEPEYITDSELLNQ